MMTSPFADFMPVEGMIKLFENDYGVKTAKIPRTCVLFHNCDFTV